MWYFIAVMCGALAFFYLDSHLYNVAREDYVLRDIRIRWHILKGYIKSACKRLLVSAKRNPAIALLIIAWVFILLALRFFGSDIYEIYDELHKQITTENLTADEYRGIAIRYFGIIAGVGAFIGYIIATARNIIFDNQNKINARVQITEGLGQAITQIGVLNGDKPNIEVRLGGLYSLQHIMQYSVEHELTIIRIFYAYVRENTKRDKIKQLEKKVKGKEKHLQLPEDIQATFDIISQYTRESRKQGRNILQGSNFLIDTQLHFKYIDLAKYSLQGIDFRHNVLHDANLSGADLSGAELSNTYFNNSNLVDADFSGADLSNANLSGANLSDAGLADTYLNDADLSYANLSEACFEGAYLDNVDLKNANLKNTFFTDVDLSTVKNLTQEQINQADGNKSIKLPDGLVHPKHWPDYSDLHNDDDDDEDK